MQIELIIFQVIIFIFSVIIHEVAHGYAAYLQGDNTAKFAGRLTLNPIPHIDVMGSIIIPGLLMLASSPIVFGWAKPVPFNPYNLRNQRWGEAMVAAAGPLSNIFIALFFGIMLSSSFFPALEAPFLYIVFINLVLAIFNLVPIPPLDGSKILFSILPYHMQGVREFLERNGLYILLFFIFFASQLISPLVFWVFHLFTSF
ncbi:MAG: site-2 protease family protein [Candidatus Zambryskibacteria bacterium]|nr:site-2 protease family protein [Candidatus Zambryskibacteria bacterium]